MQDLWIASMSPGRMADRQTRSPSGRVCTARVGGWGRPLLVHDGRSAFCRARAFSGVGGVRGEGPWRRSAIPSAC